MLSELALSALTDVILACLQAFTAGMLFRGDFGRGSPAWIWSRTMALVALLFLIGAIDHGFFEPEAHPWHQPLQTINRALVAVAAFFIAITAAMQFLGPVGRKVTFALGGLGCAAVVVSVLMSDNFFIVIGGYSLALILLLGLNLRGLFRGNGSLSMILGILLTFAASALPVIGYQGFAGLGMYGTYHVVLMPAVVAFYLGGLKLSRELVAPCIRGERQ